MSDKTVTVCVIGERAVIMKYAGDHTEGQWECKHYTRTETDPPKAKTWKGDAIEDLRKAARYVNREIERRGRK